VKAKAGHAIVGGSNYGQGSSREHAALAPRFLGLRVVIAKSVARIHLQNLINYGILPLGFERAEDYAAISRNEVVRLTNIRKAVAEAGRMKLIRASSGDEIGVTIDLLKREREALLAGGVINWLSKRTG
jgi:aconitate hydratase